MPLSDKDSVSNLVSVFSALNKIKDEPKGVSSQSSVVKDNDEKVNPNLESSEAERLKKIANIFGQTLKIGIYTPQPEAPKLGDLTPDKQKSLGISAISDKIKPVKQEGGLQGLLAGLVGLLGLGNIKNIMKKTLGWVGKKLSGILKWVGGKLLSGVKWLTGKLLSGVKWVGSKIWSSVKNIGNKLVTWGTKLLDKIKNSKIFKGFTDIIGKIKDGIKSTMDDIINSIKGFIDDILKNITKVKDAAFNALKKIPGYKAVAKTGSAVAKGISNVKGKAAVVGTKIVNSAGNLIDKGKAKIGSYTSKLFKGSSGKVGSFFKGIPLLTPLIEGLFAAKDIQNLKKSYKNNEITLDDLRQKAGERTVTAITGIGGAVLGAAALSFIPGVGTLVGGVAGDFLGRYLGEQLVEKLISPDVTKKLGSYITGISQLQDFFVKDNKVFSFSNKDEVLGIKTGGAIDNFLNSQTDSVMVDSIVSHNKFNKAAMLEQIKRQDTMIDLLMQLVRKPASGAVINNTSSNNISPFNFRDAYSAQTLVTN